MLLSGGLGAARAAAAAGQTGLMALYDSLFTMMDMQAAQLLVTASDFEHDGKPPHDFLSAQVFTNVLHEMISPRCQTS